MVGFRERSAGTGPQWLNRFPICREHIGDLVDGRRQVATEPAGLALCHAQT